MPTPINFCKGKPGRPPLRKEDKRVGFMVYIKPDILAFVEVEAKRRGVAVQRMLRDLVELWALNLKAKVEHAMVNERPAADVTEESKDGEVSI